MDRNQELLTRIRQLQERQAEAEEKMKEQLERHKLCQQSLDAAGRKLREKEDGLAEAGEVRGRGRGAASREEWSGPAPSCGCRLVSLVDSALPAFFAEV